MIYIFDKMSKKKIYTIHLLIFYYIFDKLSIHKNKKYSMYILLNLRFSFIVHFLNNHN